MGTSTQVDNLEEFWALCRRVDAASDEDSIEPELYSILAHVKSRPDLRAEFAQAFCAIARGEITADVNILSYCMHDLRWPEVKNAIEECQKTFAPRRMNVLSHWLSAYEDNPEDFAEYDYYRDGRPVPPRAR